MLQGCCLITQRLKTWRVCPSASQLPTSRLPVHSIYLCIPSTCTLHLPAQTESTRKCTVHRLYSQHDRGHLSACGLSPLTRCRLQQITGQCLHGGHLLRSVSTIGNCYLWAGHGTFLLKCQASLCAPLAKLALWSEQRCSVYFVGDRPPCGD